MKEFYNIDLFQYNTMKLRSVADYMCIPESIDELIKVISILKAEKTSFHLLSAGSNIVFSERVKVPIINLMKIDEHISIENELIECGSSVRVQKLINYAKDNGLGGIEYLYSLPSSVGGAVFMNAGRGRCYNKSISDYLISVKILNINDLTVVDYIVNKDHFAHRKSPFQDTQTIIISAKFKFIQQNTFITDKLIKERIQHSNQFLDSGIPSCGSVFSKGNPILFRLLKGMRRGGAIFSKKTPNWISNIDDATAQDIKILVKRAEKLHKFFFCKYKIEIRFFD